MTESVTQCLETLLVKSKWQWQKDKVHFTMLSPWTTDQATGPHHLLSLNKANKGRRAENTPKVSDMQEPDAPPDTLKKPFHWGLLVSEESWLIWLYASCCIQESAQPVLTDLNIWPLWWYAFIIFFASGIQSFSQQLLPAEHSPHPHVRAGIRS